jgi:uncharacterized protein YjbI with pentapeptide repeats
METSRWNTQEGRRTAAEVVERLRRRRSLDKLALGEVDGRVDLRGFPWPSAGVVERQVGKRTVGVAGRDLPELRGAHLAGLDFSGAMLPHLRLHASSVTDCRFDGAVMQDMRAWATVFEGCDLSRADLRGSLVGSWHETKGNVWRGCRFDRTRMEKVVARGALFEGCGFSSPGLADVAFDFCSFRDVRFSGRLVDVAFYGYMKPDGPKAMVLDGLDLSAAELRGIMFVGCRLSGVRFPDRGDFAVLPGARSRLEKVLAGLDGDGSSEANYLRVITQATVKQFDADSDLYVNYDDLTRDGGAACADLMRRLVLG